MTDKTLKKLIDGLNRGKHPEIVFLRPLTQTVDYAKVWLKKPSPKDNIVGYRNIPEPFQFYFIKNLEGHYRGIVFDMGHDLHCYVLPKYRGLGVMSSALQEVILPHIFQGKDEQRITIDKEQLGEKGFNASAKVALRVGFTVDKVAESNTEYILSRDRYKEMVIIEGYNTQIPEARVEELKKQVQFLSRSLLVLHTELEMNMGTTDYTDELKTLVGETHEHIYRLEDDWWEHKN